MTRTFAAIAAALAPVLASLGCGEVGDPRAQWVVHVSTDAGIPQFGDRLLVEILDADNAACPGCRRQFAAPTTNWPLSFGVAPLLDGSPPRIRVRLYRSAATGVDGFPAEPLLLDTFALLPPAGDGVTNVALTLEMACFGRPADLAAGATCDPASGEMVPIAALRPLDDVVLPVPNSWPPLAPVDCATAPPPGMVCVPGGVFLMGNPDYLPISDIDPVPEQLVQLSPFFIDVDEFRLGDYLPLVDQGFEAPVEYDPELEFRRHCAYGMETPDAANLSVNCLTWEAANAACVHAGKRLLREAEWEFAAGNRSDEAIFPWGGGVSATAEQICASTVCGRGDGGGDDNSSCIGLLDYEPGPVSGGASETDVTVLGVRNLGGNLSEWVSDYFKAYVDSECWAAGIEMRTDPHCDVVDDFRSIRGGNWRDMPYGSRVYSRNGAANMAQSIGFRCGLSAQ